MVAPGCTERIILDDESAYRYSDSLCAFVHLENSPLPITASQLRDLSESEIQIRNEVVEAFLFPKVCASREWKDLTADDRVEFANMLSDRRDLSTAYVINTFSSKNATIAENDKDKSGGYTDEGMWKIWSGLSISEQCVMLQRWPASQLERCKKIVANAFRCQDGKRPSWKDLEESEQLAVHKAIILTARDQERLDKEKAKREKIMLGLLGAFVVGKAIIDHGPPALGKPQGPPATGKPSKTSPTVYGYIRTSDGKPWANRDVTFKSGDSDEGTRTKDTGYYELERLRNVDSVKVEIVGTPFNTVKTISVPFTRSGRLDVDVPTAFRK